MKLILILLFDSDVQICFFGSIRAIYYTMKEDYPNAINKYNAILGNSASEPHKATIYKNLGEIYLWTENIPEAERYIVIYTRINILPDCTSTKLLLFRIKEKIQILRREKEYFFSC